MGEGWAFDLEISASSTSHPERSRLSGEVKILSEVEGISAGENCTDLFAIGADDGGAIRTAGTAALLAGVRARV